MIYKPARTFIARYACVLCCLLLIIMSACERVDEFGHPISYSTSPVYDECKRIPLVFPFEITDF